MARVVAPPTHAVQLLGEVGELEEEPECAQHQRLLLGGQVVLDRCDRAVAARRPRCSANALDRLQELRSFLFDEHLAEDGSEQPDVSAERSGRVGHALRLGRKPER